MGHQLWLAYSTTQLEHCVSRRVPEVSMFTFDFSEPMNFCEVCGVKFTLCMYPYKGQVSLFAPWVKERNANKLHWNISLWWYESTNYICIPGGTKVWPVSDTGSIIRHCISNLYFSDGKLKQSTTVCVRMQILFRNSFFYVKMIKCGQLKLSVRFRLEYLNFLQPNWRVFHCL